jgi:hypothetical protein
LVANGWAKMSGSDMALFDTYIRSVKGAETQITNETRPDLYAEAKHIQNHK